MEVLFGKALDGTQSFLAVLVILLLAMGFYERKQAQEAITNFTIMTSVLNTLKSLVEQVRDSVKDIETKIDDIKLSISRGRS